MKKSSTVFLQFVLGLIGLVALFILVRFPLTEGRAANLELIRIYSDPFILYAYLASIPFFVALYQAFQLLKYVRQNTVFSLKSVRALRMIKYCAIVLCVLIVLAALYIRFTFTGNVDDDPAGFIAVSIVASFISFVVATAAAVFEKTLHSATEIKSENDYTV